MTEAEALHTAARRYCIDHATAWRTRYADLLEREPPKGFAYSYSDEALATFPRYNVLDAILGAVEELAPSALGSAEEARARIVAAGDTARSTFTEPPQGEIERAAMAEERQRFVEYVEALSSEDLSEVAPLPYRRRLADDEAGRIARELHARWGAAPGAYWYPLDRTDEADPPPDAFAFDAGLFASAGVRSVLRRVLAELGVTRVWELREYGGDYEIELGVLSPVYDGAEGFWTDASYAWLVYASHESSITVAGGVLLPALKRELPAWRDHAWEPFVG